LTCFNRTLFYIQLNCFSGLIFPPFYINLDIIY